MLLTKLPFAKSVLMLLLAQNPLTFSLFLRRFGVYSSLDPENGHYVERIGLRRRNHQLTLDGWNRHWLRNPLRLRRECNRETARHWLHLVADSFDYLERDLIGVVGGNGVVFVAQFFPGPVVFRVGLCFHFTLAILLQKLPGGTTRVFCDNIVCANGLCSRQNKSAATTNEKVLQTVAVKNR